MKLLSRFIWLIVIISAIVFAGISLVHFRAENKFEQIKASISQEYDLLIDKMLSPERSEISTTYNYGITNASTTNTFLQQAMPIPELLMFDLDTMVMNHFLVDGLWFYKPGGQQFYFFSHHQVEANMLSLSKNNLDQLFTAKRNCNFYVNAGEKLYRIFGSKIGTDDITEGYVFSASKQDQRWIDIYMKEISSADIEFSMIDESLPEIPKQYIRIIRPLKSFDGNTVRNLDITLKLPFLNLWKSTTSTDNWLMTGAIILIVIFLTLFLISWVILPLKKISKSLEKGNADDIESLLENKSEMGNVARMIGDFHKKTDELEASESIKRHIIDQAQVGIIIAESATRQIITANPYACSLIKESEKAIVGNLTSQFLEELPANKKAVLRESEVESFESKLFKWDRTEVPILRTATRMVMNGRKVIMDTFVDLSEIKHLQDKLEEEKKKLSLAVQNSGLVFCEFDFKTNEIVIDKSFEFIIRGNSKRIVQNVLSNIYMNDLKMFTDKFDTIRKGFKDTLAAEFRVKHPTRGLIWVNASLLITKRDENNEPRNLIGLLQDVTDRVAIQQELIKAKEKAEESDRMKSSYLGNMSHKIRTPLNAIVGFANLISEEDLAQAEKDKFINIIRRDTEQVLHLIDDIINIAKIESKQMDVSTQNISINQMINNTAEYYKLHEKSDKIKLNINAMLPDGKETIRTDGQKLNQAFGNLVNNAFKFTNEGNIELGYYLNPIEKKITLYVKDTGIGIPDDCKDKIFTHYFQVNQMTEGTGLGLTISKSIVTLLGGKIYFESKLNEGSTFCIDLPLITA